ncbi:MAG: hypothetical protein IKI68_04560, partial [Clostridia bacterium]|nr:hypothetical protein [Clostridia bacterium]
PAPQQAYAPQPQNNVYYNQPASQQAPMEKKKLFFIIGLAALGVYLFNIVLVDFINLVGGYGDWLNFFYMLSNAGQAVALAALFFYIKEKFDEKKSDEKE